MTINSSLNAPSDSQESPNSSISCTRCRSADHLILELIGPLVPRITGRVSLEYSCGKCESFYVQDASVQEVAKFLTGKPATREVLHFGNSYIHCGEPMEEAEFRLAALRVKEGDLLDAPAVKVESSVLRCQCGFQMSIPRL